MLIWGSSWAPTTCNPPLRCRQQLQAKQQQQHQQHQRHHRRSCCAVMRASLSHASFMQSMGRAPHSRACAARWPAPACMSLDHLQQQVLQNTSPAVTTAALHNGAGMGLGCVHDAPVRPVGSHGSTPEGLSTCYTAPPAVSAAGLTESSAAKTGTSCKCCQQQRQQPWPVPASVPQHSCSGASHRPIWCTTASPAAAGQPGIQQHPRTWPGCILGCSDIAALPHVVPAPSAAVRAAGPDTRLHAPAAATAAGTHIRGSAGPGVCCSAAGSGGATGAAAVAADEPTTATTAGTAAGPRRAMPGQLPLGSCRRCSGEGRVPCKACDGAGRLKRGGYQKKNRVDLSRAIGSKWTALQPALGWRHFQVLQLRRTRLPGKAGCFLLLQANCDESAQIWVNACTLRLRSCWASGWLQMSEIADPEPGQGQLCQSCSGTGYMPCSRCMGGAKEQVVVLR